MARGFARGLVAVGAVTAIGAALAGCCCRPRCSPCGDAFGAPPPRPVAVVEDTRGLVFVEATILRIPTSKWAELVGAIEPSGEKAYRLVSADEVQAARQRWSHDKESHVVTAPKILTRPKEEATVFVGETYAGAPKDLSFPSKDANWAGFRARAVATPSEDLASLTLDIAFSMREPLAKGTKVDAAALATLPANEILVEARGVPMKSAETIVLAPRAGGASKDRILVLVRATVLNGTESGL